jgi:hypothetical protein
MQFDLVVNFVKLTLKPTYCVGQFVRPLSHSTGIRLLLPERVQKTVIVENLKFFPIAAFLKNLIYFFVCLGTEVFISH